MNFVKLRRWPANCKGNLQAARNLFVQQKWCTQKSLKKRVSRVSPEAKLYQLRFSKFSNLSTYQVISYQQCNCKSPIMIGSNHNQVEDEPSTPTLPYEITYSENLGKYMVATKDLELGEIIFQEYPLVTGPLPPDDSSDSFASNWICLECYEMTDHQCNKCGVPLCESHTADSNPDKVTLVRRQHGALECQLMLKYFNQINAKSGTHGPPTSPNELMEYKTVILPNLFFLRCLFLDPKDLKLLLSLEPNLEEWCKSALFEQFVVELQTLHKEFGTILEFPPDQELRTIKAIQDINSYEILLPSCTIQATYLLASRLEHNCIRNTHRITQDDDLKLNLHASCHITNGSHLTTCYSDLFWPTMKRQKYFQETKFFSCTCTRCSDPTECGTYLSAFLCPSCPNTSPAILPTPPPDERTALSKNFQFICINCNNQVAKYEDAMSTLEIAKLQLEYIGELASSVGSESSNSDEEDAKYKIAALMKWLRNWTCTKWLGAIMEEVATEIMLELNDGAAQLKLHPQNSLVLDACHSVFLYYYLNSTISTTELMVKIKIGNHLLRTMSPITPGISKFRCTLLHDLAKAEFTHTLMSMKEEGHDVGIGADIEESLKLKLKDSLAMWNEALNCLQYEPKHSSEGVLYEAGRKEFNEYFLQFGQNIIKS